MPLYELFVISRSAHQSYKDSLKELMKTTATSIMDSQGLVRNIEFLGTQKLPYRMKLQETYAYEGSYWLMNFFAGPSMLEPVKKTLQLNPEVIRFTVLKKADTLKHLIRT